MKVLKASLMGLSAAALMLTACAGGQKGPQLTVSGLDPAKFDTTIQGKPVKLYTLKNANGMEVCITNYGGRVVSLCVPDKDGKPTDVVLGFDNIAQYADTINTPSDYGSSVGRYANRIKNAKFTLDKTEYQLKRNDGPNCLHGGGNSGWMHQVYEAEQIGDSILKLTIVAADGENGFPGELTVNLTYALSSRNGLEISYEATTTKPTVLNLTNHSFFNISGLFTQEITNQILWVNSDRMATFDAQKNLDGRMRKVKGTPFDFRKPTRIGLHIDDDDEQLKVTRGYDHSFVLKTKGSDRKAAAIITDEATKTRMTVYTTEPVLHIYTGNGLKSNTRGKQDIYYPRRSAVCFEAMHLADSPNQPQFPSTVLRPGETFRSHTAYVFSTID